MSELYLKERHFVDQDYSERPLAAGEYEDCFFERCLFSQADLSHHIFVRCHFVDCDMSLARLKDCSLRKVAFSRCRLLGLNFRDCRPFSLSFNFVDCLLDYASFESLQIRETIFRGCSLGEADFTKTDLSQSTFEDCDLDRAVFFRSLLTEVDFRTARNYQIDPDNNRLQGARFSMPEVMRLLDKYGIHID